MPGEHLPAPGTTLMSTGCILAPRRLVDFPVFGLFPRYELLFSITNKIFPAHLFQRLAQ
jgi:hypothetical protein